MPPKRPSDVSGEFDDEDIATLKELIVEHRRRKAFHQTVATYGKWLAVASGILIALTQLRGFFRDLLK